jgi:hypothetical protein
MDVPIPGGITAKLYGAQNGRILVFQRNGVLVSIRDDAGTMDSPDSAAQALAADAAALVPVP